MPLGRKDPRQFQIASLTGLLVTGLLVYGLVSLDWEIGPLIPVFFGGRALLTQLLASRIVGLSFDPEVR